MQQPTQQDIWESMWLWKHLLSLFHLVSSTFDMEQLCLMLCIAAAESEIVRYFIFFSERCIPMAASEQMYFNLEHYEFIKECRTDIDAFIVKIAQHITSLLQAKSWANRPCNVMWRLLSSVLVWLKLAEKHYSGCFFLWYRQGGNCSSLPCLWLKLLFGKYILPKALQLCWLQAVLYSLVTFILA